MEGKAASSDQLNEREKAILEWLSKGLSNQEIADELYLSLNTVKWYNQQIYSKLGVSSRTQAIASAKDQGLLVDGDVKTPSVSRHNLPGQTTPFIGRSREIAEVKKLLDTTRLLTLTGTGGTGKTRLALRLAIDIAETFADGVYFIDLAPLTDHMLVAKAVAETLGVFENPDESLSNTLKRGLAQRNVLLVMDNFEHVIEAAPLVSELLAASPSLKILATSRESLRLSGEQEYPVPPLSLPAADADSVQSLIESEAGSLFVQRAQMALPHFEAHEDHASAVAQICIRLDGLPLAIELAAARCKLLTPRALLERLEGAHEDSPFKALTGGSRDAPPRHRTLRDTIAWSYNLLDEGEKRLFARLAVFRGGRSLEAVEAVCGMDLPIDVFDGLASLVDKSLVQQKEVAGGELRFVLLEMIYQYAREHLEASGETDDMRRRHAAYFVEMAERAEPEMWLAGYDYWCQQFELEIDNLRAILEWTLSDGDVVLGVRLAGALGLFWYSKGYHTEGLGWTGKLLERLDEAPGIYHPKFLFRAGQLAGMHDLDRARHLLTRARDIARELGDKFEMARAQTLLSYTMMGEAETAMPLAEESLALFRELNHQPGIAQALNAIGEIARISGDDGRAKRVYEECLAVSQQTGQIQRICDMCTNLAFIAQHEGDHERALNLGRQALRLSHDRQDRQRMAEALPIIAGSLGALGQPQRAARLVGASDAELERMGAFRQPGDTPEYDRIVAGVGAQLGETNFQTAWAEGRELSLEQAVRDALREAN
jgi:predicted ATPase/DNA-binding CsgD family transcriptional regulator